MIKLLLIPLMAYAFNPDNLIPFPDDAEIVSKGTPIEPAKDPRHPNSVGPIIFVTDHGVFPCPNDKTHIQNMDSSTLIDAYMDFKYGTCYHTKHSVRYHLEIFAFDKETGSCSVSAKIYCSDQ